MKIDFSKVIADDMVHVKAKVLDCVNQTLNIRFEDDPETHVVYHHEVVAHIPKIKSWDDLREKIEKIHAEWSYGAESGYTATDRIIALLNEVEPKGQSNDD
jgi:hypothetical protein